MRFFPEENSTIAALHVKSKFAKLCALYVPVPYVPIVLRGFVSDMPRALRTLVPHLPHALRALVPYVSCALRARVPDKPRVVRALVPHVPCGSLVL